MKYYIFEPEYDGVTFYTTKKEWEKAIENYDFLGKFCDDGWSECVWNVVAGIIPNGVKTPKDDFDEIEFFDKYAVYVVDETFREERPKDLPDDGYDKEGRWWGEFQYLCGYGFTKKGHQKWTRLKHLLRRVRLNHAHLKEVKYGKIPTMK